MRTNCHVQEHKERDNHFTMTHLSSMLVADKILFNSHWHLQSFTSALKVLYQSLILMRHIIYHHLKSGSHLAISMIALIILSRKKIRTHKNSLES